MLYLSKISHGAHDICSYLLILMKKRLVFLNTCDITTRSIPDLYRTDCDTYGEVSDDRPLYFNLHRPCRCVNRSWRDAFSSEAPLFFSAIANFNPLYSKEIGIHNHPHQSLKHQTRISRRRDHDHCLERLRLGDSHYLHCWRNRYSDRHGLDAGDQ